MLKTHDSPFTTHHSLKHTGLLGWPVSHSRSPAIHRYWMERYGLEGEYALYPTQEADIPSLLERMRAGDISGLNVTVPHKETVMAHLDAVDDLARAIGAVNTILRDAKGRIVGTNTDAYGAMAHLKASAPGCAEMFSAPLVLGAGGAARAVVYGLIQEGATQIRLANRTRKSAEDLAAHFGAEIEVIEWDAREAALEEATLLVNTTTLGMQGAPPLELSLAALPATSVVYDIVYAPLETELLRNARAKGCACVDGLGMLLYQAQAAFAHWWGVTPEVDAGVRGAAA